jgi:hypothetical protein
MCENDWAFCRQEGDFLVGLEHGDIVATLLADNETIRWGEYREYDGFGSVVEKIVDTPYDFKLELIGGDNVPLQARIPDYVWGVIEARDIKQKINTESRALELQPQEITSEVDKENKNVRHQERRKEGPL